MALQDEVQSFIKSHRAKLEQEKENLGAITFQHRASGILPEESQAERRRDQLRRERQEEYRAFLKQQSTESHVRTINDDLPPVREMASPPRQPPSFSISEKRRALAREREQENQTNPLRYKKPPLPPSVGERYEREERDNRRENRWRERNGFHSEPQSRQFEEPIYHDRSEGRYSPRISRNDREKNEYISRRHSGTTGKRYEWDEASDHRQVHFNTDDERSQYIRRRDYPTARKKHWDEEEEDLMEWARGQGRLRATPTPRPPSSPTRSSHRHHPERVGGRKILSAPVVASGGIAGLGAGNSEQEKKKKQREYAEQLRQQMRQKQEAKERDEEGSYSSAEPPMPDTVDRNKPGSSWRSESHRDMEGYSKKSMPPRRRERVHFSPERHATPFSSIKPPGDPASFPPYWPGLYYGGYPPPPPAPHFPSFPGAPQPGLPYYPPPPPPMNNPYYSTYYPPPHNLSAPVESDKEMARGRVKSRSSRLSPHKMMLDKDPEDELKFTLRDSESEKSSDKVRKEAYKLQLMEQMREKRVTKQRERLEKGEFERKKDMEVYDPFGKGGCGAPIRDRHGQLVTDLKRMKKVNDERMMIGIPSTTPLPGELADGGAAGILDNSFTDRSTPRVSSFELNRSKEGRKSIQEDYKETLEQQMREKEEKKRKEKAKIGEEDKLEIERIERECQMLEEKYRSEKKVEKELKIKKEALKREQEEREREEEERKIEEDLRLKESLKQEAEKKKQMLIDNMEKQLPTQIQTRSNSPPVPTLRKLDPQSSAGTDVSAQPQPPLSTSPPVPTLLNQQLIANNNGGKPNKDAYPAISNAPPTNGSPLPARTTTATIRKSVLESPEALKRSFSAHDAMPQPSTNNTGGGPSTSKVMSNGAQQSTISRTRGISQSTSDPYPSSSAVNHQSQRPPAQIVAARGDEVMENMLRNLHSVRKKLETEREKVGANSKQKEKYISTTEGQQDAAAAVPSVGKRESNKPNFLKPRVAGPKKNPTFPSDFYSHTKQHASRETQDRQEEEEEDEEHRLRRKQWKPIPKEQLHLQMYQTSPDQHRGGQQEDYYYYSSSEAIEYAPAPPPPFREPYRRESRKPAKSNAPPPPPSWLQPRYPRVQQDPSSTSGFSDFPQTKRDLRPPSLGGESQFSLATLDVDRMARRNEERMRRLEKIMNSQASDSRPPKTILSDFLASNRRNHPSTSSKSGGAGATRRPRIAANIFHNQDTRYYHQQGRPSEIYEVSESESDLPSPSLTPTY